MNIGIIGTRRRNGTEAIHVICKEFFQIYTPGDIIISGGCKQGGDRIAEALANLIGDGSQDFIRIHYPDKSQLDSALMKINPKAAYAKINYARNGLIAEDSEFLIACVAPDRKGGTEDTIKKWKKFHPHFLIDGSWTGLRIV